MAAPPRGGAVDGHPSLVDTMLRRLALAALSQPALAGLLADIRRHRCAIFMLHRFASETGATRGHDPVQLHALLAFLRRADIGILSVDELVVSRYEAGARSRKACVAFTVDDGYRDFADVGLPVFEQFDCPVTLYVVPEAVDGTRWFWWDQVEWAFSNSSVDRVRWEGGAHVVDAQWSSSAQKAAAKASVLTMLKAIPDDARRAFLDDLPHTFDVAVPTAPPEQYALLDWASLRAAEARGTCIGAHTMTHPVLARCSDEVAAYEILESARRVRAECVRSSRVFCYPNGMPGDFGAREFALLDQAGMQAAVSAIPGITRCGATARHPDDRWQLPRFSYNGAPGMLSRLLLL
jgi:peptidoglycan/xylan/chitin deacetylase (PgdA/CDA1 family)